MLISCKVCGAVVESYSPTSNPRDSQALRVVVVIHLLLAGPRLRTLGRTLIVLATTLSIMGLSSTIGLRGARILQTLRVVGVQFLADKRLLALGASGVVSAAALPVQSLGRAVCGDFAIGLGWCFAGRSGGRINGRSEGCRG